MLMQIWFDEEVSIYHACYTILHHNILVQKLHLLGIKAQGFFFQFLILPEKANYEGVSSPLYVGDSDF